MELTMAQHHRWKGMGGTIQNVCRCCGICCRRKAHTTKKRLLPAKKAEVTPWHTSCVNLMGPCKIGKARTKPSFIASQ